MLMTSVVFLLVRDLRGVGSVRLSVQMSVAEACTAVLVANSGMLAVAAPKQVPAAQDKNEKAPEPIARKDIHDKTPLFASVTHV